MHNQSPYLIEKSSTSISGFDEITGGGLPKGRPTLICGGPGSGKTLFGMEFLVRGATQHNEPGLFVSFEERKFELIKNFASLGFDIPALEQQNKIRIDQIDISREEIEEGGDYDLEGLFIRIGHGIKTIGAKRVVLDTLETLFSVFSDANLLRSELQRLFTWLKKQDVTAIITAEKGDRTYTRQGLEEYVSDCVILIDHRVENQISTRRLRVVKYRGSSHGTNEYPFLISNKGLVVFPVTSMDLQHPASTERISTGVPGLDEMLEGKGYYRASSIMVTGTAGTGKTSLAAAFADSTCRRGERCLYFAFEESTAQFVRNMQAININLKTWLDSGLLIHLPSRPARHGLETHLASMYQTILENKPDVVVIDPLTDFSSIGNETEIKLMLTRLIDFLKVQGITAFLVSLANSNNFENTNGDISSLIDTWIYLRAIEEGGERNRGLYVLKARGIRNSNQIREFFITPEGVKLTPAYLGETGLLTGSARIIQEEKDRMDQLIRDQEIEKRRFLIERKRKAIQLQMAALETELALDEQEYKEFLDQGAIRKQFSNVARVTLAKSRKADNQNIEDQPRGGVRK